MNRDSIRRTPSSCIDNARAGAVALEAALVTPALVLILIAAIDVGQFVNITQSVSNASRHGTRIACRSGTQSVDHVKKEIQDYLENVFPQLSSEEMDEALEISIKDENGQTISGDGLGEIEFGSPIEVSVSLEFSAVRWLEGFKLWGGDHAATVTTGRRQ